MNNLLIFTLRGSVVFINSFRSTLSPLVHIASFSFCACMYTYLHVYVCIYVFMCGYVKICMNVCILFYPHGPGPFCYLLQGTFIIYKRYIYLICIISMHYYQICIELLCESTLIDVNIIMLCKSFFFLLVNSGIYTKIYICDIFSPLLLRLAQYFTICTH